MCRLVGQRRFSFSSAPFLPMWPPTVLLSAGRPCKSDVARPTIPLCSTATAIVEKEKECLAQGKLGKKKEKEIDGNTVGDSQTGDETEAAPPIRLPLSFFFSSLPKTLVLFCENGADRCRPLRERERADKDENEKQKRKRKPRKTTQDKRRVFLYLAPKKKWRKSVINRHFGQRAKGPSLCGTAAQNEYNWRRLVCSRRS